MSVRHHEVLWVTCPTCGESGPGPRFITRSWNGETYGFVCGHEHHLDPSRGGARTHINMEDSPADPRWGDVTKSVRTPSEPKP